MTKKPKQLELIETAPPAPVYEGRMRVEELLSRLSNRFTADPETGRRTYKVIQHTFEQSVRDLGILHPLILTREGPDKLTLRAGRGRLQAAINIGLPFVPVRIYDPKEISGASITLAENVQRTSNVATEFDAVLEMYQEMENRGLTPDPKKIADANNMSVQTVERLLRYKSVNPEIMDAVRNGHVKDSVVAEIVGLNVARQFALIDILRTRGTITGKNVKEVKSIQFTEAAATLPSSLFDELDVDLSARPAAVPVQESIEFTVVMKDDATSELIGVLSTNDRDFAFRTLAETLDAFPLNHVEILTVKRIAFARSIPDQK